MLERVLEVFGEHVLQVDDVGRTIDRNTRDVEARDQVERFANLFLLAAEHQRLLRAVYDDLEARATTASGATAAGLSATLLQHSLADLAAAFQDFGQDRFDLFRRLVLEHDHLHDEVGLFGRLIDELQQLDGGVDLRAEALQQQGRLVADVADLHRATRVRAASAGEERAQGVVGELRVDVAQRHRRQDRHAGLVAVVDELVRGDVARAVGHFATARARHHDDLKQLQVAFATGHDGVALDVEHRLEERVEVLLEAILLDPERAEEADRATG